MFAAPYRDVCKAYRNGRLGDLNPTPWAVMLGNCCGWVTYSIVIGNLYVFFGNSPGFILSVWLNLQAIKLQYGDHMAGEVRRSIVYALEESSRPLTLPETPAATPSSALDYAKIVWDVTAQNTSAPIAHERIVLAMVVFWLAIISILAFGHALDPSTRQLLVGIAANLNLVFFYGAPLSTIFTVLRSQSSSTIHIPTMLTNTLNGTFWCAYGIAIADWFIAVPNGLGAALGGVQMALCLLFPRVPSSTTTPAQVMAAADHDDESADKVMVVERGETVTLTTEAANKREGDLELSPNSNNADRI